MKKKYVLKNKFRFAALLTIFFLTSSYLIFTNTVYGYREPAYKVINVNKGETLWSIAGVYGKNSDTRKYIYEVKKVNQLASSEIFEGMQLKIPVE